MKENFTCIDFKIPKDIIIPSSLFSVFYQCLKCYEQLFGTFFKFNLPPHRTKILAFAPSPDLLGHLVRFDPPRKKQTKTLETCRNVFIGREEPEKNLRTGGG